MYFFLRDTPLKVLCSASQQFVTLLRRWIVVMRIFDQQMELTHPLTQLRFKYMALGLFMGWILWQHADQIQTTPWYDTQTCEYPPVNYTTVSTSHANSNNFYVWEEKNLTNNRSILLSVCSWFCDAFVHDAQDFSFCHWNTSSLSHLSLFFTVAHSDPFQCFLSSPVACWIASMTNLRGNPGIFTSAWR